MDGVCDINTPSCFQQCHYWDSPPQLFITCSISVCDSGTKFHLHFQVTDLVHGESAVRMWHAEWLPGHVPGTGEQWQSWWFCRGWVTPPIIYRYVILLCIKISAKAVRCVECKTVFTFFKADYVRLKYAQILEYLFKWNVSDTLTQKSPPK